GPTTKLSPLWWFVDCRCDGKTTRDRRGEGDRSCGGSSRARSSGFPDGARVTTPVRPPARALTAVLVLAHHRRIALPAAGGARRAIGTRSRLHSPRRRTSPSRSLALGRLA